MRGRKKLLGLAVLLSFLLIIPLVLSSGIVDVSQLLFWSSPATVEPASSSTEILVDPVNITDETHQPGNFVTFHVNVSAVTDLFSWQINMSWDSSILSVNDIIPGEFLLRTVSVNKTAAFQLGYVINATDNAEGYTGMSESILGEVSGITGNGRLVSIEFLVVGYGSTNLTISLIGNLATTLLNSTGDTLSFAKAATPGYIFEDGYFRNKYPGDIDGNYYVGSGDASILSGAYGSSVGDPTYEREADLNLDGYVGSGDASVLSGNYGKTFP